MDTVAAFSMTLDLEASAEIVNSDTVRIIL